MSQQSVKNAWKDMKAWIEGTLPGMAINTPLPNAVQQAGDIGACQAFNSPGSRSTALWSSDGGATITLSSLRITSLTGVSIQEASFVSQTAVHFPINFSVLEVDGRYTFSEACALYDFGKKTSSSTATGSGNISQRIENSSLYYTCTYDRRLTLNGVTVNGTPSVHVSPDTGGLPDWLVAITNFLSTFKQAVAITDSVQNVFTAAAFTNTLITLLNKQLGV